MKCLLILITIMLVGGCATPLTPELTLEEKVVGTYEGKKDGFTFRVVLLENGIVEFHNNGDHVN